MDYKEDYYHTEDFKTTDINDNDRELVPNRHVALQTGAVPAYNFGLTSNLKPGLGVGSTGKSISSGISTHSPEIGAGSANLKKMLDMQNVQSKPIAIPQLQEMSIKDRLHPYNKSQVIILTKPDDISEAAQEKHIRESFMISYDVLQAMSPALTFQPNSKDLKSKGTFTHDFCTCRFETQVWRVEGKQYILEFRRKSLSGRDAYEYLIRHMGAELKESGRAEKYGNDIEIYPIPKVPDDLGELAMPSFGGVGSHTGMAQGDYRRGFPINLDSEDQIKNWSYIVMDRNWPSCEETLRLCARSCLYPDNRQMLAEQSDFQKAVIKELHQNPDATSCHNALTIILSLLEETGAERFVEDELLSAVARCLLTYSGIRQKGKPKTIRSVALERAALKVLLLLSEDVAKYNQKQVDVVLDVLEGELGGKLKDEVNQVQLEYIIGNLKKHK